MLCFGANSQRKVFPTLFETKDSISMLYILCLASGAPIPLFESVPNFVLIQLQEPIGGAKPKFSSATDGLIVRYALRQSIALTCPAQGFPLPGFRLVYFFAKLW